MNDKKPTSSIIDGQAGPGAVSQPLVVGIGEILWDLLPDGKQMGGAPANFAYHAGDPGHARVLAELREQCGRTIKELLDDQAKIKDPETHEFVPAKAA